MKYIRKIAASSLIAALIFFAGSFCLHPMSAQAMDAAPPASPMGGAMAMAGHALDEGADAVTGDATPVSAWNICVINCASQAPQAVVTKQFSVDFSADLLAGVSYDQEPRSLAFSSGSDLSGTHPPSPDILSSVFKKE